MSGGVQASIVNPHLSKLWQNYRIGSAFRVHSMNLICLLWFLLFFHAKSQWFLPIGPLFYNIRFKLNHNISHCLIPPIIIPNFGPASDDSCILETVVLLGLSVCKYCPRFDFITSLRIWDVNRYLTPLPITMIVVDDTSNISAIPYLEAARANQFVAGLDTSDISAKIHLEPSLCPSSATTLISGIP